MAARLKVFVTTDGLTDYVVATSSKPKALAAWGSHQDLFKTGLAHETDDPELVKAATAQPGVVLRRAADTVGALAKLKVARKPAPPTPVKPQEPAGPSRAALKKVADLEKKLEAIDRARDQALRKIEQRRAALDREAEAITSRFADERARYEAALAAARRAPG